MVASTSAHAPLERVLYEQHNVEQLHRFALLFNVRMSAVRFSDVYERLSIAQFERALWSLRAGGNGAPWLRQMIAEHALDIVALPSTHGVADANDDGDDDDARRLAPPALVHVCAQLMRVGVRARMPELVAELALHIGSGATLVDVLLYNASLGGGCFLCHWALLLHIEQRTGGVTYDLLGRVFDCALRACNDAIAYACLAPSLTTNDGATATAPVRAMWRRWVLARTDFRHLVRARMAHTLGAYVRCARADGVSILDNDDDDASLSSSLVPTPLHACALYGAEAVARVLVEQCTDETMQWLSVENAHGETPLAVADRLRHTAVGHVLRAAWREFLHRAAVTAQCRPVAWSSPTAAAQILGASSGTVTPPLDASPATTSASDSPPQLARVQTATTDRANDGGPCPKRDSLRRSTRARRDNRRQYAPAVLVPPRTLLA